MSEKGSIPTDADLVQESSTAERFQTERESEAEFHETVHSAAAEVTADADDDRDYEDSRPYLDELEARYGRPAHEVLKELADIEAQLRENPETGSMALADWYYRNGQNPAVQATPTKGASPEDGSIAADLKKALEQAKTDSGRRDAVRELQRLAKERGNAIPFSAWLSNYLAFDRQMAKDPKYHAARIAAVYGMPTQASEAAERTQIEKYLHGRTEDVRALWASGAMRSTGDTFADLRATAYALQQHDLARAQSEVLSDIAAFKKTHKDFDAVKGEMSKLLKSGKAMTLDDAYQQVTRGKSLRGTLQNELERAGISAKPQPKAQPKQSPTPKAPEKKATPKAEAKPKPTKEEAYKADLRADIQKHLRAG